MSSIEYINSVVLTTSTTSVTFANIPQHYQDLSLVYSGTTTGLTTIRMRLNGDSTTKYSWTDLYGDGSSAASVRSSNDTSLYLAGSANINSINTAEFLSYSNTNIFKTVLVNNNRPDSYVQVFSELWQSSSAISSIELLMGALGNALAAGTSITLWGVK